MIVLEGFIGYFYGLLEDSNELLIFVIMDLVLDFCVFGSMIIF